MITIDLRNDPDKLENTIKAIMEITNIELEKLRGNKNDNTEITRM